MNIIHLPRFSLIAYEARKLRQIRKYDYKLDKADLDVIGDIVTETGASFDQELLESIAMHIEDFLNQVRVIFHTVQ
jgi:hypothetical protein